MTHSDLVSAAARWLSGTRKCCPVLTEQPHSYCSEIPDAIGWAPNLCIVVECKVSVADCCAENRKRHARVNESMGDERWILAPSGVLSYRNLPHHHGLLELRGSRVFVEVPAPARDVTWKRLRAECEYLRVEMSESWQRIRASAGLPDPGPLPAPTERGGSKEGGG